MASIFDLYPTAKSITIVGIYGIKDKQLSEYQINGHLYIVSRRDVYAEAYDRFLANDIRKPEYYLIGIAEDDRYCMSFREIKTIDDAESSITLLHQALCIFHNVPYTLTNIIGYSREGSERYIMSHVNLSGDNKELKDELYRSESIIHSSVFSHTVRRYDDEFRTFFMNFVHSYVITNDKRWLFAAYKFVAGINQSFPENIVLDYSVALESLFAEGKDQISFKLRLFCALFIGESYKERKEIFKSIGDFYSIRSNIVHGNKAKITEEKFKLIERIGLYLNKSIIKSCGSKIDPDLFRELEYMYLLGAPRLMREKVRVKLTEKELVSLICQKHNFETYKSYRAYLDNEEFDDDYQVLLIEIEVSDGHTETFNGSFYISDSTSIKSRSQISYWLSHNNEEGFYYLMDFKGEI
jgi:hypothetical protein